MKHIYFVSMRIRNLKGLTGYRNGECECNGPIKHMQDIYNLERILKENYKFDAVTVLHYQLLRTEE
jgi:hypothetical protein